MPSKKRRFVTLFESETEIKRLRKTAIDLDVSGSQLIYRLVLGFLNLTREQQREFLNSSKSGA